MNIFIAIGVVVIGLLGALVVAAVWSFDEEGELKKLNCPGHVWHFAGKNLERCRCGATAISYEKNN